MKTRIPRPDLSCSREPTCFWIGGAFFLLTFFSVPFMFAGHTRPLIFGIPLWFLISLVCYFLMAALVAYVIMRRWSLAGSVQIEMSAREYDSFSSPSSSIRFRTVNRLADQPGLEKEGARVILGSQEAGGSTLKKEESAR